MCAKITPKNYIFVIQIKFIVLSKKNHRMIKEAIFVLILICTTSFDICSEIEFSDYSFDLSSISNQTIELSGLSGLIKFYNCYPDTCQNSNYPSETTAMNQQKAFLLQVVSGMCIPMSSTSLLMFSIGNNLLKLQLHRQWKPREGAQNWLLPLHHHIRDHGQHNNVYKLNRIWLTASGVLQ